MGFFSDLKEDLSQAVNEMMPEEEQNQSDGVQAAARPAAGTTVKAAGKPAFSLEEMLKNIDSVKLDEEDLTEGDALFEEPEQTKMTEGFGNIPLEKGSAGASAAAAQTEGAAVKKTEAEALAARKSLKGEAAAAGVPVEKSAAEESLSGKPQAEAPVTERAAAGSSRTESILTEKPPVKETASGEQPAEKPPVKETASAEQPAEKPLTEESAMDRLLREASSKEKVQGKNASDKAVAAGIREQNENKEKENIKGMDTMDTIMSENNQEENKGAEETMETMETMAAAGGHAVADETAVITSAMVIKGDITTEGSIDVIGTVNGNIESFGKLNITGHIIGNSKAAEIYAEGAKINGEVVSEGAVKIGASSVIIGNITATSAVIAGAVKGDIDVKGPIILDTSAIVMGNIKSKSVQINNGAVIEGMCSQCYADVSPTTFFDEYKQEPVRKAKSK